MEIPLDLHKNSSFLLVDHLLEFVIFNGFIVDDNLVVLLLLRLILFFFVRVERRYLIRSGGGSIVDCVLVVPHFFLVRLDLLVGAAYQLLD